MLVTTTFWGGGTHKRPGVKKEKRRPGRQDKRTHLVDGGLLDESGRVAGEDAVRGHDEDLVGPPFLQRLRRRHKAVDVVDDVILREERGG